jgi:transposase
VEVQKILVKDVEALDIRDKRKTGMSIADIARETGYCTKTISKWLKTNETPSYKPRPKKPSKLDPYKDYIIQRMGKGVFNCELLLREIKERGYKGGKTLVKDFAQPFRKQFRVQAVRRFETAPGEQAQVDWGYLGTFSIDDRARKVWVLTMVLGYSRYLAAHCTTSMDVESLLLGHQVCFEAIGGITRQIVYDNMKTVTLGRDLEHRPIWQSRFVDFASYHDFKPVLCTPHKPRSKGKVESAVGYIKNSFCPGREFGDLMDLNAQLRFWLDTVANVRTHGSTGKRPVQELGKERLQYLPERPFKTHIRFPRAVGRDCFFSYLGVLYSVPWEIAGSQVEVEEQVEGLIRVHWNGKVVAEHRMPYDGQRRVTDPRHFAGLPEAQKLKQSGGLIHVYPEVETRPLSVYESLVGVQ